MSIHQNLLSHYGRSRNGWIAPSTIREAKHGMQNCREIIENEMKNHLEENNPKSMISNLLLLVNKIQRVAGLKYCLVKKRNNLSIILHKVIAVLCCYLGYVNVLYMYIYRFSQ